MPLAEASMLSHAPTPTPEGINIVVQPARSVSWEVGTEDYLKSWSALHHEKSTQSIVRRIFDSFGGFARDRHGAGFVLDQLSVTDLEAYQGELVSRGLSRATCNQHLRVLKAFLRWAASHGKASRDASRGLKMLRIPDEGPGIIWTREEIAAVAKQFFQDGRALLLDLLYLGRYTGGRTGELLWLRADDANIEDGLVYFRNQNGHILKGKLNRAIPLNQVTEILLRRRRFRAQETDTPYLFPNRAGKPFDISKVSRDFSAAARAAGAKDGTIQGLRRTFATAMAKQVMPYELAKLLGHSSLTVALRFYVDRDAMNIKAPPALA